MHRILLLMSTNSYRANAFLEAAKRLRLSPIDPIADVSVVVGTDRPQVLSAANPGGNLTLNFLNPKEALGAIVQFAKEYPIRAVVSTDDDGAILAALASEALELSHNSVSSVSAARNKYRMREILAKVDILSPRFERFSIDDKPEDVAQEISFPCVIKPLSLSASRGVIRADDVAQFVVAFRRLVAILRRPEVAAQGGESVQHILVETFIPGLEVALEGLLSKGKLQVLALFDKPDPLDGPFFEETIYVTPSRLPIPLQEEIAACTAKAAAALGLSEGPVHAELRVAPDPRLKPRLDRASGIKRGQGRGVGVRPWMLEIAPRSMGGLCSGTLRFSDNMSLEELILRHSLGHPVESFQREGRAAGVMMIPIPEAGILREALGQEEAKSVSGIEGIKFTIPIGQEVVPPPEGTKYLGFIFAIGETPERVEAALREAHRRLTLIITPSQKQHTSYSGQHAGRGEVPLSTVY